MNLFIEQSNSSINEKKSRNKLTKFVLFFGLILVGCIILSGTAVAATNTVSAIPAILIKTDVAATPSGGTIKPDTPITLKMVGLGAINAKIYYCTHVGSIWIPNYKEYSSALTGPSSGTLYVSYYATYQKKVSGIIVTYTTATHSEKYVVDNTPPTVNVNPAGGTYNNGQLVTLTLSEPGTIYYQLNNGAIQRYQSPIAISSTKTLSYYGIDYAGWHSNTDAQSYIINDVIAPKVSSTSPKNNKKLVSRSKTVPIVIKFSEGIIRSSNYKNIKVKNLKTHKNVKITKSISTNKLTIKTKSTRKSKTWYQVTIPKSAISDYTGNKLQSKYVFKFKTKK